MGVEGSYREAGTARQLLENRDFTNQNATHFENTETEKGPGRERRHERGKKQSYGYERDDRGRAVQIL